MTIDVRWRDIDDDWDVYLARGTTLIAVSGLGSTRGGKIVYREPTLGTNYRILMLDYDQTAPPSEDWRATVSFQGPTPAQQGVKEKWTLTCSNPGGRVHSVSQVLVERGETADVGDACKKKGRWFDDD